MIAGLLALWSKLSTFIQKLWFIIHKWNLVQYNKKTHILDGNWKKYCFRDNSIEFESDFCWSRMEKLLIILGQNLVIPAIVILGRKPPKEVSALLLLLTEFHSKCWSWHFFHTWVCFTFTQTNFLILSCCSRTRRALVAKFTLRKWEH